MSLYSPLKTSPAHIKQSPTTINTAKYGNIQLRQLSLKGFIDASIYASLEHSGQTDLHRSSDPFRFALMAALAYGEKTTQALASNKKIADIGCGKAQISSCMAQFAKGLWLVDPDCAKPENPAKKMFDPSFVIDTTIQRALKLIPELNNFFDLVTSFGPHPFTSHSFTSNKAHLSLQDYKEVHQYYTDMINICKTGGDIIIMPLYEKHLGLKGGVSDLYTMLNNTFHHVDIVQASLLKPEEQPYFSTFVIAKNKL